MSDFSGLWKCQNNPACTKSVFIMLKLVHYVEEEEEKEDLACILKDTLSGLLTQWMMGFLLLYLPKFACSTFCAVVDVPINADQLMIFIFLGFGFFVFLFLDCLIPAAVYRQCTCIMNCWHC